MSAPTRITRLAMTVPTVKTWREATGVRVEPGTGVMEESAPVSKCCLQCFVDLFEVFNGLFGPIVFYSILLL